MLYKTVESVFPHLGFGEERQPEVPKRRFNERKNTGKEPNTVGK